MTQGEIDRVALIKAHTLAELAHSPLSVTAQDRMFLVTLIERLGRDSDAGLLATAKALFPD